MYPLLNSSTFVPETYILNIKSPHISEEEKTFLRGYHKGKWIYKPSSGFGGLGIKLIDNIDDFKEKILEKK